MFVFFILVFPWYPCFDTRRNFPAVPVFLHLSILCFCRSFAFGTCLQEVTVSGPKRRRGIACHRHLGRPRRQASKRCVEAGPKRSSRRVCHGLTVDGECKSKAHRCTSPPPSVLPFTLLLSYSNEILLCLLLTFSFLRIFA